MRMRLAFSYILIATTTNLSFFPALFGTRASSRAAISSLVVRAMSSSSSTTPNRTAPTATAGSRDGALIFLHGLGDSPAGWSSLKQNLPRWQPRLANIEYVFPAAPTIPISINGGARMPGWFDLYDWPIEVGATDDRAQKLSVGVAAVRDAIRHLQTAHNIPLDKIVVGGFSQGGAVALLAAYHPTEGVAGAGSEENPSDAATPLAGCAMLSGWLTLVEDFVSVNGSDGKKIASAATLETKTPLFWGHGRYDDKVLFDHQEYGVKKLQEFGVKTVDARQYSIGHESTAEELQALAAFVDEAIFSSTGSSGIEASASFSGKDLEL